MLSGRLVHLIEQNWKEIAARLIHRVRRHPETPVLAQRSEAELRDWCKAILENLGGWLTSGREDEVRRRYEMMGASRFEEAVPLHEAVLRLNLLKYAVIDYMLENSGSPDALQLYAEEEFERRVSRFFDALVYYVVRGYEEAMRRSVRYA